MPTIDSPTRRLGPGGCIKRIIALTLLLAGALLGLVAVFEYSTSRPSLSWPASQARILSVERVTVPAGATAANPPHVDLKVRFRYTDQRQMKETTRILIHYLKPGPGTPENAAAGSGGAAGNTNVRTLPDGTDGEDIQRRVYENCTRHLNDGHTCDCYIDPRDRSRVMLEDETLRSAIIPTLVCAAILLFPGLLLLRRSRPRPRAAAPRPGRGPKEPWHADERWRAGGAVWASEVRPYAAPSRKAARGSALFLIIFGIPFACVGVFMGHRIWRDFATASAMKSWPEVPARILAAELARDSDSDGGTTFRATARYQYTFAGQSFQGTRVGVGDGADNIGAFQKQAYQELASHRDSGQPFRCYVNPAQPSQAVLYRELRHEMYWFMSLFVLAFGGAGAGLIGGGLYALRRQRQDQELARQYPDDAWRRQPRWQSGRITPSGLDSVIFLGGFALVWNLFISFYWVARDPSSKDAGLIVVLIMHLFGLLILALAVKVFLVWRRDRTSLFEMHTLPGRLGGTLRGQLHLSLPPRRDAGLQVALKNLAGSGDETVVIWQAAILWEPESLPPLMEQTLLPVDFELPAGAQPTGAGMGAPRWELSARLLHQSHEIKFRIPVF